MPSRITQFALLSLVSSALAVPFRLTGYPAGTAVPYPQGNSTGHHHHNGTACSSGRYRHKHTTLTTTTSSTSTLTVVETLFETIFPTPVASVAVQAVSEGVAPTGVCKARPTITTTVTDLVTVTVQATTVQAAAAAAASTTVSKKKVCTKKTKSTLATGAFYPVGTSSAVELSPSSFVFVSSAEAKAAEATSIQKHHKPSPYSSPAAKSSPSSSIAAEAATSTPAVYSTPTPIVYSTSSAAVPSSAPAASSAAPVSSSAPSYSGIGKRGLAYNDASLTECFVGNSKIAWAYNWGQTTSGLPSAFEYVPMIWGLGSDSTSSWFTNAKKAISSGSKHLLSFNEPDYSQQANLSPAAAAVGYMTYMQPFKTSNPDVQLGGPAVTNGGNGMGLDWLSSFLTACSECDVDFYPLHWYDSASNAAYFKSHIEQAHQLTGKPIWVTEFGATGTDAEISSFLEDVMSWMDSQDYVLRYAYFMVEDGKLVSGKSLSDYGKTYATA